MEDAFWHFYGFQLNNFVSISKELLSVCLFLFYR